MTSRGIELSRMSYKQLLGTEEWKERRKKILIRDSYRCAVCMNNKLLAKLKKGTLLKIEKEAISALGIFNRGDSRFDHKKYGYNIEFEDNIGALKTENIFMFKEYSQNELEKLKGSNFYFSFDRGKLYYYGIVVNSEWFYCNRLDVHHIKYTNQFPWNAPDKDLITLCSECHKELHIC